MKALVMPLYLGRSNHPKSEGYSKLGKHHLNYIQYSVHTWITWLLT
jgi:hypothetical protein